MREFAKAAQGLTRNPLGVIGLFIVLVYGFACLVLGLAASQLQPDERSPLIWFIVIFPALILGVFYRLVTAHHKKLYAPSDYKDERLFLSPLSDEQRAERLETEVQRVEEQEAVPVPSVQIQETPRPTPAIRSAYADAERLAFLELEKEVGKPFRKYVQVSSHGRTEEFDGVLITKDEAHLIEVKYFSRPAFKREFLEALIHRASTFMWDQTVGDKNSNITKDKVIFWIAIVVDFPKEALPEFKRKVEEAVRCDMFVVNLRFFQLDDLKAKYG
ncbi:MAG TPA: hypothetical protein VNZ27_05540 [Rhodanobacter sp.]|jgi:hypothetical protein|nr:hypothetical protein [Rhodanobacter sp.]